MDLGLKDQVALVTAASRGLGKAAAMALAQEGAKVSICARSQDLEHTADEIVTQTGSEVLAVRADVTKPKDIQNLLTKTLDRFKRIDILIVNAGGPPPGTFLSLTPDDWKAAADLTLMSAVYLCYAVVPHMLEAGSGSIVTTQSYSVKQPIDNLILSNSLRMAVIGMMKSMANELGPKGIRVNSINPAWTWTERVQRLMQDRVVRNNSTMEKEQSKITREVPLGRMGTVDEYGKTIAWLASPAASFIHGHALMFDGGAIKASL
ncbi:MAG: 3-oxoacyl-ACP reductase [Chloroflexi bacterium RBG_16_48_8]|nr:MAG: 3-oxoacyl-ACP reductase [Chloroflexi bacterium RBG_16_48_8]